MADYEKDWERNWRYWGAEPPDYRGTRNYPLSSSYMNYPYYWNAEELPETGPYYNPPDEYTTYWNTPRRTYEEYWWATPGPYTGRGPRGYVRSDEDILEDVCERLAANGRLDASDIEVTVGSHEVTLKGTVGSRQDKRLAEDIAETVFGVEDVNNQLKIERGNQPQASSRQESMKGRPDHLYEGQQVVGSKGKPVGTVREIHAHDFVMDRPMATDVHVPFTAVQDADGNQVRLTIPGDQIDRQGWTHI